MQQAKCGRGGFLCRFPPARRPAHLKRCVHSIRRQQFSVRAAAASPGSSEDPYKVLSLPKNADSEAILRAYRKKLRDNKGNEAAIERIEAAHTALLMRGLSSRLTGGAPVAADVKYADRAVYFPWRPRLHKADRDIILYAGVAQAVLAAWAVLLSVTAGSQPIISSACVGAGGNIFKLFRIFPPASGGADGPGDKKKQGIKNIFRGALLATAATFLGCALFFTLPDFVAAQLNRTMPYWFYESETTLLALGTALANWVMTSFFR